MFTFPAFIKRWFFSTNHKDIGTLYFTFGTFASVIGTIISTLVFVLIRGRVALDYSGELLRLPVNSQCYTLMLSLHAVSLLLCMLILLRMCGFFNWFVPLLIGAFSKFLFRGTKVNVNVNLNFCFITSILLLLSLLILLVSLIILLIKPVAGINFCNCIVVGDPTLDHYLYWAVYPYILILLGFSIVSQVLPLFFQKPVFGRLGMIFAMLAIGFLGFIVWGYPMYFSGVNVNTIIYLTAFILIIVVLIEIKIFSWMALMWGGSRLVLVIPMVFSLGFLILFTIVEGFYGVILFNAWVDGFLYDLSYVVTQGPYVLFQVFIYTLCKGFNFCIRHLIDWVNNWVYANYFLYLFIQQFIVVIIVLCFIVMPYLFLFLNILFFLGSECLNLILPMAYCDNEPLPPLANEVPKGWSYWLSDLAAQFWNYFFYPKLEVNVPLNNYPANPTSYDAHWGEVIYQRDKSTQTTQEYGEKVGVWSSVWQYYNKLFNTRIMDVISVPPCDDERAIIKNSMSSAVKTVHNNGPEMQNSWLYMHSQKADSLFQVAQVRKVHVAKQLESILPPGSLHPFQVDLDTFKRDYLPYMKDTYLLQEKRVYGDILYSQLRYNERTAAEVRSLWSGQDGIRSDYFLGYKLYKYYPFVSFVYQPVYDHVTQHESVPGYALIYRNFITCVPVLDNPQNYNTRPFIYSLDVVSSQWHRVDSDAALQVANQPNAVIFDIYDYKTPKSDFCNQILKARTPVNKQLLYL